MKHLPLLLAALSVLLASAPVSAQSRRRGSSKKSAKPDSDALDKAALRQLRKVQSKYCDELCKVAASVAKKGLVDEAKKIEAKVLRIDPENRYLSALKKRLASAEQATDEKKVASAQSYLKRRLTSINKAHGGRLFDFAKACMRFGLFTKAFDMLHNVLEVSPDDRDARKVLGYKKDTKTKEWITKWEYDKRKKEFLTPEGWFAKKDRSKFEKGMRPYQGKWIAKEREKEVRSRGNAAPYTVQSEHFVVKSNMGREKAWEIAQLLEDFYGEFFRTFIGYYDQVAGAKLLFNTPSAKLSHLVVIFPDRDDYAIHVKEEKGNDPLLLRSGGFYSSADRLSRFFWTGRDDLSTLYHEVGHQLFAETKPGARGGSKGNNWVVEGAAVYLETWKKEDGRWIPGGNLKEPSLVTARRYLEQAGDKWDIASFAGIDHDQFHGKDASAQSQRHLNYCMAGALTHFFMHYDDEVYKEDFVKFLSDYYAGKVREGSLGKAIKDADGEAVSFGKLEEQFRAYMKGLGSK